MKPRSSRVGFVQKHHATGELCPMVRLDMTLAKQYRLPYGIFVTGRNANLSSVHEYGTSQYLNLVRMVHGYT